jgi:CubicO group peptidase (beta-lactamase class C family)
MSDREAGVPYDVDTVFSLGSITKQFTAAAILKLEMQRKLRVEDPVAKLLPGVPADKQAITIHQLQTHTSGLDSDFADDFDPVSRASSSGCGATSGGWRSRASSRAASGRSRSA